MACVTSKVTLPYRHYEVNEKEQNHESATETLKALFAHGGA